MSQPTGAPAGKQPSHTIQLSKPNTISFINWVAISADGSRVIANTYFFPYAGITSSITRGTYGTYCFDGAGRPLWHDEYFGDEGVFAVAISADGSVAAGGGLFCGGLYSDRPDSGILRAYDAYGKKILDCPSMRRRVNYISLSADGGVLAAVESNKLCVFLRKNGVFPEDPIVAVGGGFFLDCVAVHPSGEWIVCCDRNGNVNLVSIVNGVVQPPVTWNAPGIQFLSVAISKSSDSFVVGGGNVAYLFTKASLESGAGPIAQYTPNEPLPSTNPQAPSGKAQNIRWVAISDDGKFIAIAENVGSTTGLLRGIALQNGKLILAPAWAVNPVPLSHNPNSVSMDLAGKYITVADGNPVNTPGTYYLFQASDGTKLWDFATSNMNWPMFISANGAAIAAGSDNGNLYFFHP